MRIAVKRDLNRKPILIFNIACALKWNLLLLLLLLYCGLMSKILIIEINMFYLSSLYLLIDGNYIFFFLR